MYKDTYIQTYKRAKVHLYKTLLTQILFKGELKGNKILSLTQRPKS